MTYKTLLTAVAMLVLATSAAAAAPRVAHAPILALETPVLERLASSPLVDPALIEPLRDRDLAAVTVYFARPSDDDPLYTNHPARGTDVGPLLFDLVTMSESAEPRLEDFGYVQALTARMRTGAIATLIDNPYVLAIDRARAADLAPAEAPNRIREASHGCTPSAFAACLQGGRFRVQATHGGTASRVAASGSASAVFWTFGSANWEIVAKVLNGCSVNNHFWVFAAGATSVSYTLSVEDTTRDLLNFYSNAPCPLQATTAFPCP